MRKLIDIVKEMEVLDETPEEVRSEIEKRVNKIPDEQDLVDVLKFTKKYSIKKDVQTFTSLRNYKGLVADIFLQSLADADLPEKQVQGFLKKLAKDGILNIQTLLTPGVIHSYTNLIDQNYRDVFDKIKGDLFQKISGKIGEMGDVGKGEYMLDIISPEVNRRGAPGDLDIDGTKIELKAGENGRIGPAGSLSLAGRFQREFVPVIKKLVPEKGNEKLNPTDFNFKLNMSYFSDFFGTPKKVRAALEHMLKMHYPDYDCKSIVDAVVSGITIDGQALKKEMLKASYSVYQAAKEFDGIIIMDSNITKFLYVNTPENMAQSSGFLTVSFPSWTDQQSNCMKVTLAKGGRGASASASAGGVTPTVAKTSPEELDQMVARPTKVTARSGGVEAPKKYGTDKTLGRPRQR
jgi:hypothetical protein